MISTFYENFDKINILNKHINFNILLLNANINDFKNYRLNFWMICY